MEDTICQILNQNLHKYDDLYNQLFPETIYENVSMLWSVGVKEESRCGYIVSKVYENDANNPLDSIFPFYCRWKKSL